MIPRLLLALAFATLAVVLSIAVLSLDAEAHPPSTITLECVCPGDEPLLPPLTLELRGSHEL